MGQLLKKYFTSVPVISEGLMHVAAWYHGTRDQSSRNAGNKFRLARPPNIAKFRRAPTKSVRDIFCEKILLPGKVGQSSP